MRETDGERDKSRESVTRENGIWEGFAQGFAVDARRHGVLPYTSDITRGLLIGEKEEFDWVVNFCGFFKDSKTDNPEIILVSIFRKEDRRKIGGGAAWFQWDGDSPKCLRSQASAASDYQKVLTRDLFLDIVNHLGSTLEQPGENFFV